MLEQVPRNSSLTFLPRGTIVESPDFFPYSKFTTISLFAGCGGLDLGFAGNFTYHDEFYPELPFRILQAYDNDTKCVETYKRNIGEQAILADLASLPAVEMPKADVLIGGF